ncbi:PaaI family thioesterase [Phenylobacterium sp.]|uniref:PaaI family thioesterase n=1 Tax=Phenylobacterium sp. TaxID=1871053 RepID=UPI0035B107F9
MIATALDGLPAPPCAELLGWRLLDARPADGWVRVAFEGRGQFRNPAGVIQGGLLAAMLDDTMGPAVFVMTEGALFTATIDMNVSFLAPAKVGPLFGEGQVIQLGKSVAFIEARLMDEAGTLVARATSSARLIPAAKAL